MDRARIRVLVADDDRDLSEVYRRNLVKLGFTDVLLANNGEEAIVKTLEYRPNVVILDVMMPILNGWEVCKQIKSNPSLDGTRVIMLTAIGPSLNELTSPIYGADAYLDKPVDFSWIEKEMKKLFPDEVA